MQEDTISIDNQNSEHWDPNQEGQRFKEFIFLKKKRRSIIRRKCNFRPVISNSFFMHKPLI